MFLGWGWVSNGAKLASYTVEGGSANLQGSSLPINAQTMLSSTKAQHMGSTTMSASLERVSNQNQAAICFHAKTAWGSTLYWFQVNRTNWKRGCTMLVFIPALQQCFEILMSAMNYLSGLPGISSSNSFFASLQYIETTRAFTVFNEWFCSKAIQPIHNHMFCHALQLSDPTVDFHTEGNQTTWMGLEASNSYLWLEETEWGSLTALELKVIFECRGINQYLFKA
jgi:hypothetical protein